MITVMYNSNLLLNGVVLRLVQYIYHCDLQVPADFMTIAK